MASNDALTVRWVARPLADAVTPLAWRAGLTANTITYFHLLLSVGAIVLLGVPGWWPAAVAALLWYFGFVLDCVDGNIARLDDSATYYGKFLDGLTDAVFVLLAPVAAGVGMLLGGDGYQALLVGGAVTIAGTLAAMIRTRVSFFRELQSQEVGAVGEPTPVERLGKLTTEVLIDGTFFAPALLFLPGGRLYFVLLLVVVQMLPDLVLSVLAVRAASRSLRHHRRSRHAA